MHTRTVSHQNCRCESERAHLDPGIPRPERNLALPQEIFELDLQQCHELCSLRIQGKNLQAYCDMVDERFPLRVIPILESLI